MLKKKLFIGIGENKCEKGLFWQQYKKILRFSQRQQVLQDNRN